MLNKCFGSVHFGLGNDVEEEATIVTRAVQRKCEVCAVKSVDMRLLHTTEFRDIKDKQDEATLRCHICLLGTSDLISIAKPMCTA